MSLAHMLNRNPMAKAMVPVLPHFYLESSVFQHRRCVPDCVYATSGVCIPMLMCGLSVL